MIIEISGVGFHNMGAELMLVAVRDELTSWPGVDGVAIHYRAGSRADRDAAGCVGVFRREVNRRQWVGRATRIGVNLMPSPLLRQARLVKPAHVDALVDASGFAFGDQWMAHPIQRKAHLFRSYSDSGKPVVLLPQAFGPFTKPDIAAATRTALEQVDLVFARDPDSRSHLLDLGLSKPVIALAPDFTNLVEGPARTFEHPTMVVIPNGRMPEMVESVTEASYLAFLRACVTSALEHDFAVGVMAHESMDRRFSEPLCEEFGARVSSLDTRDPVATKATVGGAAIVVSSRYHGIANALSQGVPTIGTSWSHKYAQLFVDYGCPDGLWEVESAQSTRTRMDAWLTQPALDARRKNIDAHASRLKSDARAMWSQVKARLIGT